MSITIGQEYLGVDEMNIVHYFLGFPPLHDGGLMIYARDLAKEQAKMGHNVMMLMPGEVVDSGRKSKIKFFAYQEGLQVYKIVNPQPVSLSGIYDPDEFIKPRSNNDYQHFLLKYAVDVLHVHSLIGFPRELLDEAKTLRIKTVFTTHDYYGLCPRIHFYKYNYSQCENYENGKECVICNQSTTKAILYRRNTLIRLPKSYKLLSNIYHKMKKIVPSKKAFDPEDGISNNRQHDQLSLVDEKSAQAFVRFRKYYQDILENFDVILFNSNVTQREYSKYINLSETKSYVLHVTHSNISDHRCENTYSYEKDGKVTIIYMGSLTRGKGFFDLASVLNELKNEFTNWELHVYGNHSVIDTSGFDKRFFKFHGPYSHRDLKQIFSNSSVVVIPSKLKETFGFIGLEAYSYGIPVMASENVGFSDLIENGLNGIVYKESANNRYLKEEIENLINDPSVLVKFNYNIIKGKFDFDMRSHCEKVLKCYCDDNFEF